MAMRVVGMWLGSVVMMGIAAFLAGRATKPVVGEPVSVAGSAPVHPMGPSPSYIEHQLEYLSKSIAALMERSQRSAEQIRSSGDEYEGRLRTEERMSEFVSRILNEVRQLRSATPGDLPVSRRLRTPEPDAVFAPLPKLNLDDKAGREEFFRTHRLMTVQEVLDTYGWPDEISEHSGMIWTYVVESSSGWTCFYKFRFSDGFLIWADGGDSE